MQANPTIAIVGRPNVGKSAIFNRMVGRRIAIVHDQPGVTRDRLSAPCRLTDYRCLVMDTGGIGASLDDGFAGEVAREADLAMETADMILFVVDCRDHLTPIDRGIAQKLRRAEVPVLLVLNKADTEKQDLNLGEFASLGFKDEVFVSAAHGRGFGQLTEKLNAALKKMGAARSDDVAIDPASMPEEEDAPSEAGPGGGALKVAVVGRPNAGKSSLVNAILKDSRTIVSDVAGTTRDAVDIPYEHDGQSFMLIDTAGMRQRSRRDSSVEVFSAMRSEKAIRRSDICLLIIDIAAGVTAQDRRIGGLIADEGKPCVIIVNKFDLFHPSAPIKARLEEIEDHIRRELFFLDYAPFVAVSAKEGQGIEGVFRAIERIRKEAADYPTTGALNRMLQRAMEMKPPAVHRQLRKRLKLFYATAVVNEKYTAIPVPNYVLFVNDKRLLADSYAQYLRNAIRSQVKCSGVPIRLSPRSRVRHD